MGAASLLLISLAGCRSSQYNQIVKETYIHKYGVPVAKSDWEEQGKEGRLIKLRSDGVTVSETYAQGVLHGETSYTFPNSSTIQWIEKYENGELVAKVEHYCSGVPMREECYAQKQLVKLTRWYEDGTPAATEAYEEGYLMQGEYRTPLNLPESHVQNGVGVRICRSSEGYLLSKDTIQYGEMTERITYFPNGDPAAITPYEKGEVHGMLLTYLQGGQPNTAEQWTNGVQEGMTIVYLNGEKYAEVPYVKGKKNGIEVRYRDGEQLVEEVTWKEDEQHGERKLYVDGETKTEWYLFGELVNRATFERMNFPR